MVSWFVKDLEYEMCLNLFECFGGWFVVIGDVMVFYCEIDCLFVGFECIVGLVCDLRERWGGFLCIVVLLGLVNGFLLVFVVGFFVKRLLLNMLFYGMNFYFVFEWISIGYCDFGIVENM